MTHKWSKCLELYRVLQIIAFDILKAFDKVWHVALLNKLHTDGIPVKLFIWVDEDSVPAPTLFLLDITDLLSLTLAMLILELFTIVFRRHSQDLEVNLDWETKNLIRLNAFKTQVELIIPQKVRH